jgi:hypothetical protein
MKYPSVFLTSGFGIRDGKNPDPGIGIRNKHPESYFQELNNNYLS